MLIQLLEAKQNFSQAFSFTLGYVFSCKWNDERMEIKYIKHEDIDKTKWNSCIHYANNGNIFGYKWFLDNTVQEWDALVEGDYESVMPLPFEMNFWGQKRLVQPAILRELGVFSIHSLSAKRIETFFEHIPKVFKNRTMRLNEQVKPPENQAFKMQKRYNHQLLLVPTYDELANQFSRELLLQLESTELSRLRPTNQLKPERIAAFYKANTIVNAEQESYFHAIQRIMWNALHRGWGTASGVTNEQGDLLAVNFFIYSHGKVMSFCPAVSKEGHSQGAMAYLFNALLRSHAGRPMILDFNEQTPALAAAFGAQKNHFYHLKKKVGLWS